MLNEGKLMDGIQVIMHAGEKAYRASSGWTIKMSQPNGLKIVQLCNDTMSLSTPKQWF